MPPFPERESPIFSTSAVGRTSRKLRISCPGVVVGASTPSSVEAAFRPAVRPQPGPALRSTLRLALGARVRPTSRPTFRLALRSTLELPSRPTFRCPLRPSSSTVMGSPPRAPIKAPVRASSRTTFGASFQVRPNPRRSDQTAPGCLSPAGNAYLGSGSVRAACNRTAGAGFRPPLPCILSAVCCLLAAHLVTTAFFTDRNPGASRR